MKFVRLNEYKPKRTAEILEAIDFCNNFYALEKELKLALKESGRIVTASINLLQIKIAQSSQTLREKQKLISYQMGDELMGIKAMYPDDEEARLNAIEQWFEKSGFKNTVWEALNSYTPQLINAVKSKFNTPTQVAEEAVQAGLAHAMMGKEDEDGEKKFSPIVSSLASYDPSQGTLTFDYLKQRLNFSMLSFIGQYFKQSGKETSSNQLVGDNNDTEVGDMLSAEDNDEFDIKDYSEISERLINSFNDKISEMISENRNQNVSPAQRELNKNLILKYSKADNELRIKVYHTSKLANAIEQYENNINQNRQTLFQLSDALADTANNIDEQLRVNAEEKIERLKSQIQRVSEKRKQAIQMFDQIMLDLDDMRQLSNDGSLMQNPDMPVPGEQSVEQGYPEAEKTRRVPKPGKEAITPQNLELIQQGQIPSRERLLPWIYKSTAFSESHPVKNDKGIANISLISKTIKNPDTFKALISGNYDGLSDVEKASAAYVNIIMKNIMALRDIQVINKQYDTLEMTEGKNPKEWFIDNVVNDIANSDIINSLNPSYKQSLEKSFEDFLLAPDNFRSMYLKIDSWVRGASYNEKKEELHPDKQWGDLSQEEREQIAKDVYQEQYETGVRRFYLANPQNLKSHGARIPVPSTHPSEYYINQMTGEIERIPLDKNWFATESDPEKLMFKKKTLPPKSKKQLDNPIEKPRGIQAPTFDIGDDNDDTLAYTLDSFIKLANAYDRIGLHKKADSINAKMQKMIYG